MNSTGNYNELMRTLYSGIICDVLDEMGYRNQALGCNIRPVTEDVVLLGKAFTAIGISVTAMPKVPFKFQLKSLDALSEGEIYVITTMGSSKAAFWGELLSTAVMAKNGTGALIDGMARDIKQIKEMKFPLFSKGYMPTTSKGRLEVIDYQIPIEIDGVRINPGDTIFGDVDGVVVIPKEIESKVFEVSLEKINLETDVRERILKGESLSQVYEDLGIL